MPFSSEPQDRDDVIHISCLKGVVYTRRDFLHLGGYDEARVRRVAAPPQRHMYNMAKKPSVIIRHPSSQKLTASLRFLSITQEKLSLTSNLKYVLSSAPSILALSNIRI